jgi:hypothetical protein
MLIASLDISINGTGIVKALLDNETFEITNIEYLCFSSKKKTVAADPGNIILLRNEDFPTYIHKYYYARDVIKSFLLNTIMIKNCIPEYVAIEDYAYSATANSYHIGEFTMLIKQMLFDWGCKVRPYDITLIKIFATDNGNALKPHMVDAFNLYNGIKFKLNEKLERDKSPTTDLVDAFWILKLLQTEIKLRKGIILMKDLPENQIRVFNRTTPTQKENILARSFIHKDMTCK